MKKILCPTDFSDAAQNAIALCGKTNPGHRGAFGISKTLYAEDIKLTFVTIRLYEIAESVHSYVLRTKPDMLALCAVRRNLLERFFHNSLIRNISSVSSYPVFIFHE